MKRRRSNISAALAIAVERQVDEIIAVAKGKCALHAQLSVQRASARAFAEQEIVRQLQRDVETARFSAGLSLGEIIGSRNGEGPRDNWPAGPQRLIENGSAFGGSSSRYLTFVGVAADSDIASGHTQFQSLRSGYRFGCANLYRHCLITDPNVAALFRP